MISEGLKNVVLNVLLTQVLRILIKDRRELNQKFIVGKSNFVSTSDRRRRSRNVVKCNRFAWMNQLGIDGSLIGGAILCLFDWSA